jgi:hypothetical protein
MTLRARVTADTIYNAMMAASRFRPLTGDERDQMRRWLENWRDVHALLETERIQRLERLTESDAALIACDLWRLAYPGRGDDAEGLIPLKHALAKAGSG